jgi:hypothetical protein
MIEFIQASSFGAPFVAVSPVFLDDTTIKPCITTLFKCIYIRLWILTITAILNECYALVGLSDELMSPCLILRENYRMRH